MLLVMSVLSWFKFSLWNHWYRPKKINIFLHPKQSQSKYKNFISNSSELPAATKAVVSLNDFITIPNSFNNINYKNFLFTSSRPSVSEFGMNRPKIIGTSTNLNLILFKSNLFLSLHHATRAINLGLVYINFNPVYQYNFIVQPLNIISIVSPTGLNSVLPSSKYPLRGQSSFKNLSDQNGRGVKKISFPTYAKGKKAYLEPSAAPRVNLRLDITAGGRNKFQIFTGLQFWFGFTNFSSSIFETLNFPYFLINTNIKSIIFLHPSAYRHDTSRLTAF